MTTLSTLRLQPQPAAQGCGPRGHASSAAAAAGALDGMTVAVQPPEAQAPCARDVADMLASRPLPGTSPASRTAPLPPADEAVNEAGDALSRQPIGAVVLCAAAASQASRAKAWRMTQQLRDAGIHALHIQYGSADDTERIRRSLSGRVTPFTALVLVEGEHTTHGQHKKGEVCLRKLLVLNTRKHALRPDDGPVFDQADELPLDGQDAEASMTSIVQRCRERTGHLSASYEAHYCALFGKKTKHTLARDEAQSLLDETLKRRDGSLAWTDHALPMPAWCQKVSLAHWQSGDDLAEVVDRLPGWLRELDVRASGLREIPEELFDLPAHCTVDLRGNPLSIASVRGIRTRQQQPVDAGPRFLVDEHLLVRDERPAAQRAATFWTDLAAAEGANRMGLIELRGELAAQASATNPQGPVSVVPEPLLDKSGDCIGFALKVARDSSDKLAQRVYWLPWQDESAQTVSMETLGASGCRILLTSALSGCRLALTDTYVSHIAHGPAAGRAPTTTERDAVERAVAAARGRPRHRRKLSGTREPGPRIASGSDENAAYAYRDSQGRWGDAIGFAVLGQDGWVLKWLEIANDPRVQGHWHASTPVLPAAPESPVGTSRD